VIGDNVADRVVLGDLADRIIRKLQLGASTARSLEHGITVSIAPKPRPAGRVTFRVRDAAIAQPANPSRRPPMAAGLQRLWKSAKGAESPLTFAS
jgi:hypothetical protein